MMRMMKSSQLSQEPPKSVRPDTAEQDAAAGDGRGGSLTGSAPDLQDRPRPRLLLDPLV